MKNEFKTQKKMNLNKLFYDWSNEVYVDRNKLVFEGKNQSYGAFHIRQEYNRVLFLSLLYAFASITLLAAIPSILSYFKANTIQERIVPDTPPIDIYSDIIPTVLPPKTEEIQTIKETGKTVEHIIPIVDNTIHDTKPSLATNSDLDNAIASTKTQTDLSNNNSIDIAPPTIEMPVEKTETPLSFVDKMPEFIGGIEGLQQFMAKNLQYPQNEKEMGISGTVYVYFVINRFGKIEDAKIVRGVKGGSGLEKEALRVINSMPIWQPGLMNEHPVKVQFTYPVRFVLN